MDRNRYGMHDMGHMDDMDERSRNVEIAKEALREFERIATNGGTLELEIDRYGHVRLKVTINPVASDQARP